MFPNFGLVNQMTNHLANNGQPKILDYSNSSTYGYEYNPPRADITNDIRRDSDSVIQQKMFNEFANNLIYDNNKYNTDLNVNENKYNNIEALNQHSPRYDFIHRSCHDNNRLYCPVVNNYNRAVESFRVNDTLDDRVNDYRPINMYNGGRVGPDMLFQMRPYAKYVVIVSLIMVFMLFYMMVLMYLSQKNIEMMMFSKLFNKDKYKSK